MIHRILQIGGNDKAFVTQGRAYTTVELWIAGLASPTVGGW
jgi:hypothetical protein